MSELRKMRGPGVATILTGKWLWFFLVAYGCNRVRLLVRGLR